MIVVCKCGQKNRVKSGLVTGAVSAKDVLCGNRECRQSIKEFMSVQTDQNADIVLGLVTLISDLSAPEVHAHMPLLARIGDLLTQHGMGIVIAALDEDDEEDNEEDLDDEETNDTDDEDDEEEPKRKKKKVAKKKVISKSKSKRHVH